MATWKEAYDAVLLETGRVTQTSWLTPSIVLYWMSSFIHECQAQIGIMKCTDTIQLNATSTDGIYDLSCSVDAIEEITYSPNQATVTYIPITRIPLDGLHRLITEWPGSQNQTQVNTWWYDQWVNTNLVYCAVDGWQLHIYPYTIAGIATIRYKPLLPPFTPSDTKNWAGFGTDPSARMAAAKIPHEFETALSGIVAYAKCKVLENTEQGMASKMPQYQVWKLECEKAKGMLRRRNVDYQQDTLLPTTMGGIF